MKVAALTTLVLVASVHAGSPARGEALFDQSRMKPFAVRAMGFDKSAFRDTASLMALPVLIGEREALELQVPGLAVWPVASPVAMVETPASGLDTVSAAVPRQAPQTDHNDPKGPRVW